MKKLLSFYPQNLKFIIYLYIWILHRTLLWYIITAKVKLNNRESF